MSQKWDDQAEVPVDDKRTSTSLVGSQTQFLYWGSQDAPIRLKLGSKDSQSVDSADIRELGCISGGF